jgi:hypothetical protein
MMIYELVDSGSSKGLFMSMAGAIQEAKGIFTTYLDMYAEMTPEELRGAEPLTTRELRFERSPRAINNTQLGFTIPKGVPMARYSQHGYFIVQTKEVRG